MKRLLLLCCALAAMASPAWGGGLLIGSGASSSIIYKFLYNGDYPQDTDKAYVDSGNSSKDGEISGATVTNDYITIASNDQYIRWAISAGDIFETEKGTIFFSVYIVDSDSNSDVDTTQLIEIYVSSNNYLYFYVSDTANKISASRRGGAGTIISIASNSTITFGGWYRVGYSWDNANALHALKIETGDAKMSSWTGATEESEATSTWSAQPSYFVVGENAASGLSGGITTDTARIKDIIITNGYKDADQLP